MANIKEAFQYASQNPNSDFAKNLEQLARSGSLNLEAKKYGIDLTPFQPQQEEVKQPEKSQQNLLEKTGNIVKDLAIGAEKGATETAVGLGQLALRGASALPLPQQTKDLLSQSIQTGEDIKNTQLKSENTAQGVGKFAEQVAEYAVPATKVATATKGLSLIPKVASRALTSGAVASAQSGKVGKESLIAAGTEVALPVVGKVLTPVKNIVSRLIKGLSSGLSGVGTDTIDKIVTNPSVASQSVKELNTRGNIEVLRRNAKIIVNGVSNIKKEARQAYRTGLEALKNTDIDEKLFKDSTKSIVRDFKSGKNIEFSEPKNINKVKELLSRLPKLKLDGNSLKKYIDDIESSAYKIATSDERLAFNAFIRDFSKSVKSVISKSTDKLDDINKAYSKDLGLAQSIEKIFGKVQFKNVSEINKVAQKLETVFSQKGLSPQYVDDFLTRIGISPEAFKTNEAVRQITNKTSGANTKGLSIGEIMQQATSSVITPTFIRDVAILTGKSKEVIKNLLEKTAPSARGALIKSLISVGTVPTE